jgi:hypothetical protein
MRANHVATSSTSRGGIVQEHRPRRTFLSHQKHCSGRCFLYERLETRQHPRCAFLGATRHEPREQTRRTRGQRHHRFLRPDGAQIKPCFLSQARQVREVQNLQRAGWFKTRHPSVSWQWCGQPESCSTSRRFENADSSPRRMPTRGVLKVNQHRPHAFQRNAQLETGLGVVGSRDGNVGHEAILAQKMKSVVLELSCLKNTVQDGVLEITCGSASSP